MLWVLLSSILMGIFYIVLKARNMVLDFRLLIEAGCAKVKYHAYCIYHQTHWAIIYQLCLSSLCCRWDVPRTFRVKLHFSDILRLFQGQKKSFERCFRWYDGPHRIMRTAACPCFIVSMTGGGVGAFIPDWKLYNILTFFDTIMGWWQWQHLDYWRETFFWGCHRK